MNKLAMLMTAALCIAAAPASAHDDKRMNKNMETHMKAMDANKDGMISRDEFMRFHEMRWNELKKNSSGMVDMKDMHSMHNMMWYGDKAGKADKMEKADKDK